MSLDTCIPELVASGALDREQADYVQRLYAKLRARQREAFGKYAADATAGYQTVDQLDKAVREQRRQVLLDVSVKKDILNAMGTYRGRPGKFEWGNAGEAIFVKDDRAPYRRGNLEYNEQLRRKDALATVDGVLRRYSRNMLGMQKDAAGSLDLLMEMRGEKTGNQAAAEAAAAVTQMQDLQLAQRNAAGGNVARLEHRGVAQAYESARVARASRDEFKTDMKAHLAPEKMIDSTTGEAPTPEALDQILNDTYESIRTERAGEREEGAFGGMKLANRGQDHRFFIYKSAKDWMAIAEKYGNPNVYDAIMAELHTNARDIAAMETLGPNPAATVRWLKDVVMNKALLEHGSGSDAVKAAQASINRIDNYWGVASGATTHGERNALRLIGSGLRAHQVYTKLGSAVVTAMPADLATTTLTRAFNGIPAVQSGFDYLKYLALPENRDMAARFGFVGEQTGHAFSEQARFFGQEMTGEWQARLAEGVMRASGMKLHTDAARMAFSMETMAHITDELGRRSFAQLDPRFRRMFERYGINASDWAAMQAAPLVEAGGAKWFHPDQLDDSRLRDAIMRMIYTEQDMAVVTPGLRARAFVSGFGRPGTWQGELARTLFQFKSFPLTVMMDHGARMLALEGGFAKGLYGASFLLSATMAGWFALEVKAILKGQDPRPLNVKTLMASLQQGGGLGIYGDFLFNTQNRSGQGLSQTLLGPSATTIDAASALLVGAPILQAEGEKVDYDRQLVRLLRSETPGGSLWYARLAWDRIILDQWQAAADPNYYKSWRTMEKRARDFGTRYYWEPGEMAPGRPPDLSNLAGGTP